MWTRTNIALLVGSSLGGFGGWIDFLAILTLAAYEYNANAFEMAIVSASFLVPSMLLGSTIGRWIDRSKPKPVLVIALLVRSAVTALLLLTPAFPVFFLLVLLRSTVTIPIEPASNVLVTRLVQSSDVPRYFGVLSVLRNMSKIAAPTIGAVIASRFGENHSIVLSIAVSLLGAAFFLIGLREMSASPSPLSAAQMGDKSTAKPHLPVMGDTLFMRLVLTMTVFAFMVFVINNQLPVLLRNAGFDKALLGVLVSCSGAGGIVSAAYLSRRKTAFGAANPMRWATIAVFATALCFVALGIAFTLPAAIASYVASGLFFCTGVFAAVVVVRSNTVVVQQFPSTVASASGTLQAYQSGAMLAAPWVAAFVIPFMSMQSLFVADGALAMLALAFGAVLLRNRKELPGKRRGCWSFD